MTLTRSQVDDFEQAGILTIDTPFTADELAAACQAAERMFQVDPHYGALSSRCFEWPLLHLGTHPFVAEAARACLKADAVRYRSNAISRRHRRPEVTEFHLEGEHSDSTFTWPEFTATPRKVGITALIWLNDVTMARAPMMVRPGSHRLLADHVATLAERPEYFGSDALPDLPYADPVPVLARAGQLTLVTLGSVHSGTPCLDDQPRLAMFNSYIAVEHDQPARSAANPTKAAARNAYLQQLASHLPEERHHLLGVG